MMTTNSESCRPIVAQGLARCMGRGRTYGPSPLASICNRDVEQEGAGTPFVMATNCNKIGRIGTWNVRSLSIPGKLETVLSEMKRMKIGIMGVAETCWNKDGSFSTPLSKFEEEDKYKVFFSEGESRQSGVGVIIREDVARSVMSCEPISDRIIIMRLKVLPVNMLVVQIYAPYENEDEQEKDRFYERLDQVILKYRKSKQCIIVMGDFNGIVGDNRDEDTVGPFGVGVRNGNGERVVNFCKRHDLFVTNTWFEQKKSRRYTWISQDKETKDQIDYVLVSKRFRNGVTNSKSRPGADCGSDHKPVIISMQIRLLRGGWRPRESQSCNTYNSEKPEIRSAYQKLLEKQLKGERIDEPVENDEICSKFGKGIEKMDGDEICGKDQFLKKQDWMTSDILQKIEERKKCKKRKDEEQFRELKHEIRRLCRKAKANHYKDKCNESEMLDCVHI